MRFGFCIPQAGPFVDACERFARPAGPVVLRHMPGGRTEAEGSPLSGPVQQQQDDLAAYHEARCDELLLSWGLRSPDELLDRLGTFLTDVASGFTGSKRR